MKRNLMAVIAALALCTTAPAAWAVSITSGGFSSQDQAPTTKLTKGPNNSIWLGLSPLDPKGPNTQLNKQCCGAQDWPFQIIGINAGQTLVPYTSNLGGTHPARAIILGPDGAIWSLLASNFTFSTTNPGAINPEPDAGKKIARATKNGVTDIFTITNNAAGISTIATGPDGNIWYSLFSGNIGKMTTSGQTTEYNIGYAANSTSKNPMIAGPDGNLWMIGYPITTGIPTLVKINPATGTAINVPLPNAPGTTLPVTPVSLAAGPDGNVWYVATTNISGGVGVVGKVTPGGQVTAWSFTGSPGDITAGPDGNVWFTKVETSMSAPNSNGNQFFVFTGKADRIDTSGTLTEYTVFAVDESVSQNWTDVTMPGIVTGPDGKLYMLEYGINRNSSLPYVEQGYGVSALTPDAPTVSSNPTIAVLTSGNGNGSVKMSIGANPGNSQQLVTLTAISGNNSVFSGWSDTSCSSLNTTCQIVLSGSKTVTASFTIPQTVKSVQYQGAVFSSSQHKSYIRLYGSQSGGIVNVNLIDPRSGKVLNTTQVSVGNGTEVQIGVDSLVPTIAPDNGLPSSYTVSVQATNNFNGYYQHVVWDPTAGALSNLTACDSPLNNTSQLGFVDSTLFADYPSVIVVTNTSNKDIASAALDILAGDSGFSSPQLGTYQSDTIPANSSLVLNIAEMQSRAGVQSSGSVGAQFIIKPQATFTGRIQHLISNNKAGGILTDMTTVCPLSAQ